MIKHRYVINTVLYSLKLVTTVKSMNGLYSKGDSLPYRVYMIELYGILLYTNSYFTPRCNSVELSEISECCILNIKLHGRRLTCE